MKLKETGQGLVEYLYFLMLLAAIVAAILGISPEAALELVYSWFGL